MKKDIKLNIEGYTNKTKGAIMEAGLEELPPLPPFIPVEERPTPIPQEVKPLEVSYIFEELKPIEDMEVEENGSIEDRD